MEGGKEVVLLHRMGSRRMKKWAVLVLGLRVWLLKEF